MGSAVSARESKYVEKQARPTIHNLYSSYKPQTEVNGRKLVPINGDTTKEIPHCLIVAVYFKKPGNLNQFCGSGILLSRNLILTAAHNIFDQEQNTQFQKTDYRIYEVSPNNEVEIYHEIEDWRYLESWKNSNKNTKVRYDYALIKLKPNPKKPIVYKQFLKMRQPCQCVLRKDPKMKLQIYGYPGGAMNFKPLDKQRTRHQLIQYGDANQNSIIDIKPEEFKVIYAVSTLPGQSGSPVLVDNQIIAIHNGQYQKDISNIGRLVTSDLLDNVETWAKQLGGQPISIGKDKTCPHKTIDKKNIEAKQLKSTADKLKGQQKYGLALEKYEKCLSIIKEQNGEGLDFAVIITHGIGDIYQEQAKYSKALKLYKQGLDIFERKDGKESQNSAIALNKIGWVYYQMAKYNEALGYINRALTIWDRQKGRQSVESGKSINSLGLVYKAMGDYSQATKKFLQSLEIYKRLGKGRSTYAANVLNNMGLTYRNQKDYQKAISHFKEGLKLYQSIKVDSIAQAVTLMNIGIVYVDQEQFRQAIEYYNNSITIYNKQQLRHRGYADVRLNMGAAYYEMKRYKQAAQAYRRALQVYEEVGISDDVRRSAFYLAQSLNKWGDQHELKKIIQKYRIKRERL